MTDRNSEHRAVQRTLLASYCPPLIRQARERQDELLIERFRGGRHRIADLGCGDGYHGSIFGPAAELYHGFEISPELAAMARRRWRREGLERARVFEGDVTRAEPDPGSYDLVFCLYFTPGNFPDVWDDLGRYTDEYLDANPVFVGLVERFHRALRPGGSMWLTVYRDVPAAEEEQWDFYLGTGQHPVTPRGSRFVATREGFWSARWTRASMLSNLAAAGIEKDAVTFHELNEIAWLVAIGSPPQTPNPFPSL